MKLKRVISLMLVVLLTIGLIGCRGDGEVDDADKADVGQSDEEEKGQKDDKDGKEKEDEKEPEESGKLFDKPFKISLLYADGGSWPFKEDWFVKEAIEEATGIALDVIVVDASKLNERIHTTMASGDLADIIGQRWMPLVKQYAMEGAYVEVDKNLEKVPNFHKWSEQEENKADVQKFRVEDGKLYSFPLLGYGITNTRIWFYRKDIFDKHGLSYPKDPDEFYDVLSKLKEWEDPEAYPFNYRERGVSVSAWGVSEAFFYDEDANKWCYGRIDDRFKEHVEFMRKLYAEELISPEIYSMDAAAWTDMMIHGQTYITHDYIGRLEGLIEEGTKIYPEYELAYMPPINETSMFTPTETASYTITQEGRDEETIDNMLKYMNWLYSDEAEELLSWGEEGLTYRVEDGKRRLVEDYRAKFGISNVGFAGAFDRNALINSYPDVCVNALQEQSKYEKSENPAGYMPLTDAEREQTASIVSEINSYAGGAIKDFITGKKPMEEWDDHVKQVKSMGLDTVLDVYTEAYERFKESIK